MILRRLTRRPRAGRAGGSSSVEPQYRIAEAEAVAAHGSLNHTLDVMNWVMDRPPLHAIGGGVGLKARPKVGNCSDHFVVLYEYPDGCAVQFTARQFKGHGTQEGIRNRMFGSRGVLETQYGGEVLIRGEQFYRGGKTTDIYTEGAVANIAAFHDAIGSGEVSNATVAPSVESTLVSVMGRTAAYENRLVTWKEAAAADTRLLPNLKGLRD